MPAETAGRANTDEGKRTYRACLHCRQRKSRCDLDSNKPPCSRCIREQRECILAPSRRGGHRVRKSALNASTGEQQASVPSKSGTQPDIDPARMNSWQSPQQPSLSRMMSTAETTNRIDSQIKGQQISRTPVSDLPATSCPSPAPMTTIDQTIAAANLQNPSDALNILAQVEDEIDSTSPRASRASLWLSPKDASLLAGIDNETDYPLIRDGNLSVEVARRLIHRYKTRYHPYFPIAHRSVFVPANLAMIANTEPHLLTAILTVASKDETVFAQVHADCSAHMQRLLSTVICQGAGDIETVEALLILAEWVPQRLHSNASVGHGEEDRAAWMQVGCAIRLGYLQELDQTCFKSESPSSVEDLDRKRLAWAACYVSDRQISVRIGKAFWSRGPGPMTSTDFPSLQSQNNGTDDYALTFQAHLELTQLFSNAHDILYGTKSHRDQLYAGGQYVKYLDDFRGSIRIWHNTWGSLSCSANLKSTLILSYEYLRLYVNAFAYQATLNRAVARQIQHAKISNAQTQASLFSNVAATPDARFIYEALDAAKSILSTFNSFIEPADFQAFPLKYYFYIIYSVVFLYKARATGAFGIGQNTTLRRSIYETIDRLQRTSVCPNDLGHRYSRLLRLLWRKPPNQLNANHPTAPFDDQAAAATANANTDQSNGNGNNNSNGNQSDQRQAAWQGAAIHQMPNPLNMFSWRDLEAVGQFATANNSVTDCTLDVLDDESGDGLGRFEMNFEGEMTNFEGFNFGDIVF